MTERCVVCGKFISDLRGWICEYCEGIHCPSCSGEHDNGYGEYSAEEAYSICQNCYKKIKNERDK